MKRAVKRVSHRWTENAKPWLQHSWNRLTSLSLLITIILWVSLALLAYTLLGWILSPDHHLLANWIFDTQTPDLDRIKFSFTSLGGIAAVGYLVIKFRERSSLERAEADEKLSAAVEQLGSDSPQVRIAGVYALANVADTYRGDYNQRVVDIFCGYLRTDRLLKDKDGNTRYATKEDGKRDLNRPLSADGPVESTILTVLTNHLRMQRLGQTAAGISDKTRTQPIGVSPRVRTQSTDSTTDPARLTNLNTDPGPWSRCNLDLHGTQFIEEVNFRGAHLGKVNLRGSKFYGKALFGRTTFANDASLSEAHFFRSAEFYRCHIYGNSFFERAAFREGCNFSCSTFKGAAYFTSTYFHEKAFFEEADFRKEATFWYPKVRGALTFHGATFSRYGTFYFNTTDKISFNRSAFNKRGQYVFGSPERPVTDIPKEATWATFNEFGEFDDYIDENTPNNILDV